MNRTVLVAAVAASALSAAAVTAVFAQQKPKGCEYQWTGNAWTLVDSNCPGSGCSVPANRGMFVGQTVYKPCDPIPSTAPATSNRGCCD